MTNSKGRHRQKSNASWDILLVFFFLKKKQNIIKVSLELIFNQLIIIIQEFDEFDEFERGESEVDDQVE